MATEKRVRWSLEADQSVTPVVDEVIGSVNRADSIFTRMGESIGSLFDRLGKGIQDVIGGMSDLYDRTKERSSTAATALGIAFSIFLAGTLAGAIYTVYKLLSTTAGFIKGLFTGDSYRSQYIDDFLKINTALKSFQKELGVSAEMASAWEDAMARSGKTSTELLESQRSLEKAINEANQAYIDEGMTLEAFATRQQTITDAVKKFGPEIKKTEAIVVASYTRMAEYGLLVTERHQKAAAEYETATRIFQRESELTARGFKQAISDTVMPILGDLAAFFQDGFPTAVLVFRGSIAAITALFYGLKTVLYTVAETGLAVAEIVGRSFLTVTKAAAQALTGDFAGSMKTIEDGKKAIEARWTEMQNNIVAQARQSRERIELAFGFNLSDGDNLFMPLAAAGKVAATNLQKDFKTAADEIDKTLQSFYERSIALFQTNLDEAVASAQGTDKLTKSEKDLMRVMNDPLWAKIAGDQQKGIMDKAKAARVQEDHNEAIKKAFESAQALAEIDRTVAEEISAMQRAGDANVLTLGKENEVLQSEIELLGKTTIERQLEALARQKSLDLAKPENQWRRDEIDKLYQTRAGLLLVRDARTREMADQVGFWTQLSDLAGGFAGALTHGVGSAFDYLKKQARQFFADMVSLFVKRWVLQLGATALGGTAGGSALASAATTSGSGTLAGAAGSAIGGYIGGAGTAIGGAYGAGEGFAMGWASGVAAPGAGLAEGAGAAMSGIWTGIADIAAAIPVWGWILLAIMALVAIFSKPGGAPKVGGSFLGAYDAQGNLISDQTGSIDRRVRLHDETAQDSAAAQIAQGAATAFARALKLLGGSSGGMQFGIGFNTDPGGTAPSMVSSLVRDALGQEIFVQANRNVGRKPEELQAELQLQSQRAVLAALQASTFPTEIANILNSIVAQTATAEQINSVLQAAADMKNVLDVLKTTNIKGLGVDAIKAWQQQGETLSQTLVRITGAFAQFDEAFMTDAQKVAAAQQLVSRTFAELGVAVPRDTAAFYDLMHSIDVSTEAGRSFVERLLQIAPAFQVASAGMASALAQLYNSAAGMSSSYGQQYAKANLDSAARKWLTISGSGGNGWDVDSVIREVAGLIQGGTSNNPGGFADALKMVESLGPEAVAAFQQLLDAFRGYQSTLTSGASTVGAGLGGLAGNVGSASDALANLASQTTDAKKGIADWLQGLLLDNNLSPLNPQQRLDFAHESYVENLLKAQHGDVGALSQYTGLAQSYLTELRNMYGSDSPFLQGFAGVADQARGLAGLSDARPVTAADTSRGFQSVVDAIERLRQQYLAQDAGGQRSQAEEMKLTRRQLADLAQAMRDGDMTF